MAFSKRAWRDAGGFRELQYAGEDQAFTAAGVPHTIVNAQGDPSTQASQADQAITNGAKVILLVDLDPGSGAAIIK